MDKISAALGALRAIIFDFWAGVFGFCREPAERLVSGLFYVARSARAIHVGDQLALRVPIDRARSSVRCTIPADVSVRFYPIYPIKFDPTVSHQVGVPEPMGTKQKWWLVNRVTERRVLFKLARGGTGEDWSEKVAFELARHLHIPCSRVELARWEQRWGVLCWDFLEQRYSRAADAPSLSLIHGNELLLDLDPDYPAKERYHVTAHTVSAVHEVLKTVGHLGRRLFDETPGDGFDMFVGYLMLDALIGNTDRHHENWGVVTGHGLPRVLAPSYDHASSLGRELSDEKRAGRLTNPGKRSLQAYASKTTAALCSMKEDSRRLTPRDALLEAGELRPQALITWQRRLDAVSEETLRTIIDRVPDSRLSSEGKRFTLELLRYNLKSIIELNQ